MFKAAVSHREGTIERLRESEENQREHLIAAVEENGDMPEVILEAIREIAEARGYKELAEAAHIHPKALYKILDEEKDGKPRFETISKLLHALGLRIKIEKVS